MIAHSYIPRPSSEVLAESRRVSWPNSINSRDSEGTRIRKDVLNLYDCAAESSYMHDFDFKAQGVTPTPHETPVEASVIEEAKVADTAPATIIDMPNSQIEASDPNIVDWDGEDDRTNPLNWPKWKKALNITIILMMCVTHSFAATAFIPSIRNIQEDFDWKSTYLSVFIVSAYVLGFATGPLLIIPLSEIFGRVPMYHFCNLVFICATCWCAVTKSLVMLAMARLLAGCGGGVTQVLAASSVADMTKGHVGQLFLTVVCISLYLTPAISPLVGCHIHARWGWRHIFWITAIMGSVCTITGLALLFETYEPVLLWRKAHKLRRSTHNLNLRARLEANSAHTITNRCWNAVCLPIRMLLSPSIFVPSSLPAVGSAFLYIVYITLPEMFFPVYTWNPDNSGLAYLGIAVGILIVLIGGRAASDSHVKMRARKNDTRPENRLIPLFCFWPLTSLGLFLYGFTVHHKTDWVYPMVSTGLVGAGVMSAILFNSLYIFDTFPTRSASGILASLLLQSLLAGVAPLLSNKLYEYLAMPFTFYCLGAIALSLAPVPWILYMLKRAERKV